VVNRQAVTLCIYTRMNRVDSGIEHTNSHVPKCKLNQGRCNRRRTDLSFSLTLHLSLGIKWLSLQTELTAGGRSSCVGLDCCSCFLFCFVLFFFLWRHDLWGRIIKCRASRGEFSTVENEAARNIPSWPWCGLVTAHAWQMENLQRFCAIYALYGPFLKIINQRISLFGCFVS